MTKKAKTDDDFVSSPGVSSNPSSVKAEPTSVGSAHSQDGLHQIRQMFELPYLQKFMKENAAKFRFHSIDIEAFEESLLHHASPTGLQNYLLLDIICKFIRFITNNHETRIISYEKHLNHIKTERNCSVTQPLTNLNPTDKLKLIKWLSDETKNAPGVVSNFISDEFESGDLENKVMNAGQDSENRTYWYFDDLRLYRARSATPEVKDWQCVATTLSDWRQFLDKLKQCSDIQDQELYKFINYELFPTVSEQLNLKNQVCRPTDEQILRAEEEHIQAIMSNNGSAKAVSEKCQQIKSANPELSKVLSEEPSGIKQEADKTHDSKQANGIKQEINSQFPQPPNHQTKQVFVFSTQLANRAAEQVATGKHGSIIASHIDDPETKVFLQKNPQIKISPHHLQSSLHPNMSHSPWPPSGPWPHGARPKMHPGMGPMGQMPPPHGHGGRGAPDLSHTMVPDENLTAEQLQVRNAKREQMRQMRQALLRDEVNGDHHTDYMALNMAQDRQGPMGMPEEFMYGGQPMGPNGPGMPPGHPGLPPGHPGMGPGHPGGHGPMPPGSHPHMGGPGMPHHPGMVGGHPEPGMNPNMMHAKPPPPYQAPEQAPAPTPAPRTKKKRKNSVQAQSPVSPHGQIKSPKVQIPPSPLANPPGMGPQGPHFPSPMNGSLPPGHPAAGGYPGGHMPPHNGMPPSQGSLLQAGPPEPFQSGMPPHGPIMPGQKPPPSYSASTKRGPEPMTTPPSQMHFYSQFDNQELTIVKQPNTAYRGDNPEIAAHNAQNFAQNMQHPQRPNSNRNAGAPTSPMVSRQSSVSNITSASLVSLAKGVEQNLNQMQASMNERGPFGDLQQQQQQQQQGGQPGQQQPGQQPPGPQPGQPGGPGPNSSMPSSTQPPNSGQPSVNNTYVNAHMSIGQVNIQNVSATQHPGGPYPPGEGPRMQQNIDISMNNANMNMPAGPTGPGGPRFPEPAPGPNVKVQNKGPNTIQYLPMSQAALPPGNEPIVSKPGFDYMPEKFGSPLSNLENKTPSSKISYYPENQPRIPAPPQRVPITASPSPGSIPGPGAPVHAVPSPHVQMSSGMHPPPSPHVSHPPGGGPYPPPPAHMSSQPGPGGGMYPAPHLGMPQHSHHMPHGGPGGMLDHSLHSPHAIPGQSPGPMMISHPHGHPMSNPQSPYHPGEYPPHMHNGYPGEFPPNLPGMPHGMSRQMSHPGTMPPQHMMMSQGHGQYMNGPGPGPPYMMG